MKTIKKIIIHLYRKYVHIEPYQLSKVDNGFIYGNKYYKTIDDLKEDLISDLKETFIN